MIHPYTCENYVKALSKASSPLRLEGLNTWVNVNNIPSSSHVDAQGAYPLTPLTRPDSIKGDMEKMKDRGVVSLVVISDSLDIDTEWYSDYFDFALPYKEHFVIDRSQGPVRFSKHHRYEARKSLRTCTVRFVQLLDYLDEWCLLYEYLSQRHDFGETHLFSRDYFLALALMKELKAVGVFMGEELVSCYLWFVYGEKAYLHLGGSSAKGYHSGATYLAIDFAVSSFQQCQYLDIGGTPDQGKLSPEGLNQFKRGFTRNTRKNWICGSIIQPDIYSELCLSRGIDPKIKGFFPAYRTPLRNKG